MSIKAIETIYNGYRFRSRLEARWAVFFDALNIHYEYEPEGFDLGAAGWYLPDFWLLQVNMWAEVKPTTFTDTEKEKCRLLTIGTGHATLMLEGSPALRNYWAFEVPPPVLNETQECWLNDFVLCEGHRYWEDEGRFYGCTGATPWEVVTEKEWGSSATERERQAITVARSARFEYGENG